MSFQHDFERATQRAAVLEALLQEWINNFGGTADCDDPDDNASCVGRDCKVCSGHMESEEVDLDPGHDVGCIQLQTCIALHGKPQRTRAEGSAP